MSVGYIPRSGTAGSKGICLNTGRVPKLSFPNNPKIVPLPLSQQQQHPPPPPKKKKKALKAICHYLSALGFILPVFVEAVAQDVPTAASHVH